MDTEGIPTIQDKENAVAQAFEILESAKLYPALRRMYHSNAKYYIELGGYNERPGKANRTSMQGA